MRYLNQSHKCEPQSGVLENGGALRKVFRIHAVGTMNIFTIFCPNPFSRCFRNGGTPGRVKALSKSVGFIPWVPWISVPKFTLIHVIVTETFP